MEHLFFVFKVTAWRSPVVVASEFRRTEDKKMGGEKAVLLWVP